MHKPVRHASLAWWLALGLAACGGGGGDAGDTFPFPSPAPADGQRAAAATTTAQSHPLCNVVQPFYWEIGDLNGRLASGTAGTGAPTAGTTMSVASASKWVYGAYVAELRTGGLTVADVQFLTFRSGYKNMPPLSCAVSATVDTCLNTGANGTQDPAAAGKFFYNGGHMQRHAHDIGLGPLTPAELTAEVQSRIGDFGFVYSAPQPPGGIRGTADGYAAFLRKMLAGQLRLAGMLGTNAVCTNPATCSEALFSPAAPESWHYSIGHWVEDDPDVGDGAFSSPGAFGFYPWIDRTKTWYGVLARESFAGEQGVASAQCGRLIRKAWVTGVVQ